MSHSKAYEFPLSSPFCIPQPQVLLRMHCPVFLAFLPMPISFKFSRLCCCSALIFSQLSHADTPIADTVLIHGSQPSSLPAFLPTSMEGMNAAQIEQNINALDVEDALKYLPSLLVRKRYVGDYNHAVLSSRASGTGNSARSAVYADGILLSNYLGNGATYTPRWGLVTPEEVERVDVMYGPYSAAYRGNSVGAIVDYVTRMPKKFAAQAKFAHFVQDFDLYASQQRLHGKQASFSLGNQHGDWSWWLHANRSDNAGQAMVFVSRALSTSVPAHDAIPVEGAVASLDRNNMPWLIIGTQAAYHTIQDHLKAKLAYQIKPTLRLAYTVGIWQNHASSQAYSYLRDRNTQQAVYSGNLNINGKGYSLSASDFPIGRDELLHLMHGLSLKSNSKGVWDGEIAMSEYRYQQDQQRSASSSLPNSRAGGSGSLQSQDGTGWQAFAAKAIWRPKGAAHILELGVQYEKYRLHISKQNLSRQWQQETQGQLLNEVGGKVDSTAWYVQDRWQLHENWLAVLGLRYENWRAEQGYTRFSSSKSIYYPARHEHAFSPKAAIAYQWHSDTVLKASLGRAVRAPTVAELYGATSSINSQYLNDPAIAPEKSWTGEISLEKEWANSSLRVTVFRENVRDALYTQTIFDAAAKANISRVQNITRILTNGVELTYNTSELALPGLSLSANATYADSRIKENAGFVNTAGDTIGKRQPRVPVWRASALLSYQFLRTASIAFGMRYSGQQFGTLNNADVNGFAYQGSSQYFTTDLRLRYAINKEWSAAFGIDNLNNYQYWNFHPYPQRSYVAELKYALQ